MLRRGKSGVLKSTFLNRFIPEANMTLFLPSYNSRSFLKQSSTIVPGSNNTKTSSLMLEMLSPNGCLTSFLDHYDAVINRNLPLDGMLGNDAVDHLMELGVKGRDARKYVDNFLKKFRRGGLSETAAIRKLTQEGMPEEEARRALNEDLYDSLTFTYPRNYPVKTISFSAKMSFPAELRVSGATAISHAYLSELLTPRGEQIYPLKKVFHDHYNQLNRYRQIYNVMIDLRDDEETTLDIINHIFNKLENAFLKGEFQKLNGNAETLNFDKERNACLLFAKRLCTARMQGFPGGNYYFRHPYQKKEPLPEEPVTEESTRELFNAIYNRDKDSVLKLLRTVSPNAYFYGGSLLATIFPNHDDKEKASAETILSIFELLIEFGANVGEGFNFGTALATAIFYARWSDHPKERAIYEKMISILMRIDNGNTCSYMDAEKKVATQFDIKIAEGQNIVATKNSQPLPVLVSAAGETIEYPLHDVTIMVPTRREYKIRSETICIETLLLKEISDELYKELYSLFKNSPPWKDKLDEAGMEQCFKEILEDIQGSAYIDLVYLQDQLVGYNIAQYVTHQCAAEKLIIHHAKLLIMTINADKYPGLSFFMLYHRSFLPIEHGSQATVLSVRETAAIPGLLLGCEFNYFPNQHILSDYIPALKDTIYQNVSGRLSHDDSNHLLYIADPIASYNNKKELPVWESRSSLTAKRYANFFKHGQGIVVIFKGDEENYKKYREKLPWLEVENTLAPEKYRPGCRL